MWFVLTHLTHSAVACSTAAHLTEVHLSHLTVARSTAAHLTVAHLTETFVTLDTVTVADGKRYVR